MTKKFLNFICYRITKNKIYSFNHIYISFFTKNSSIINVGANQGESVDRFLRIFQNPKFNCFESALDSFDVLKKKIYINEKIVISRTSLLNAQENSPQQN